VEIYECSQVGVALRQGELLTDLKQPLLTLESVGTEHPRVRFENHPFAIVLSQDCDLSQDWRRAQEPDLQLRQLPAVLFAQAQAVTTLRNEIKKTEHWQRLVLNKDERYHFLEAVPKDIDALGIGLPELGIDFKRYFTIPTDEVYRRIEIEARRRCRLKSPYLEHLSTRFCYYQFRVALPKDHQSAPA